MSESYLQLPTDGSGKKLRVLQFSGANYEEVIHIDESGIALISGQKVVVEGVRVSGTVQVSGVVTVQSGLVEIQSPDKLSGLYLASGLRVVVEPTGGQVSGAVIVSGNVTIQSGVYFASGIGVTLLIPVTSGSVQVSGTVAVSGVVNVSSGLVQIISPVSLSGLYVVTTPSGGGQVSGTMAVSGNVGVSGVVTVQSGLVEIQSPSKLSGLFIASGVGVVASLTVPVTSGSVQVSGTVAVSGVVIVSSGLIQIISPASLSGLYVIAALSGSGQISGTVAVSGVVNVASGLVQIISPASLSGLYIISSPSGGGQVSGAVIVSGTVNTSVSGNIVTVASGVWNIDSTSGKVWVTSGSVTIQSGVDLSVPLSGLIINNSGNPLFVPSNSGGVSLWSASVRTVTLKCHTSNVNDIYLGAHVAGNMPYSGQGFIFQPGEIWPIDVPQAAYIRVCAANSGDRVSYIGT